MKKSHRFFRMLPTARRQSFLRPDASRRPLGAEALEARNLMAGLPAGVFATNYFNAKLPADVNNDGAVKINDALAIISTLRQNGARSLASGGEGEASAQSTSTTNSSQYFYDVNNDTNVNIVDAVNVIRTLRAEGAAGDQATFQVIAVPTNGDGSNALVSIEKGQTFDLLVFVKDMRDVESVINGGLDNPKLDINFDATKAHAISNETQFVILRGTEAGTTGNFQLTFDGVTVNVPYSNNTGATATNIRQALESIPTIGAGNVAVSPEQGPSDPTQSGSPNDTRRWRVQFQGDLKDTDVPSLSGNAGGLGAGVQVVIDDGKTTNLSGVVVNGLGVDGRIEDANVAGDQSWLSSVILETPYNVFGAISLDPEADQSLTGLDEFGAIGTIDPPLTTDDFNGDFSQFPSKAFMRIRMIANEGIASFSTNANASEQPVTFYEPTDEVIIPTDMIFAQSTPFAIRQYVNAIADTNGGNPFSATVGGSSILLDVRANDAFNSPTTAAPPVTGIQITRVGSAAETLTGNLFASNSGRTALGGTVVIENGQVRYTPPTSLPPGSPTQDSFVYTVEDTGIGSRSNKLAYRDTQIVKINLTVPTLDAVNDTITLAEAPNTPPVFYDLNVLANDSLGNSAPVTVIDLDTTAFDALGIGTLEIINGGVVGAPQVRFTPSDVDYFTTGAPITFGYTVRDSATPTATEDSATVTLTITNTNDAPVVPARTGEEAEEGTTTVFNALLGATPGPANESSQTLTLVANPTVTAGTGTVVANGNNIEFTPAVGFLGNAVITYSLRDNGNPNLSTQSTISLTVVPVARPGAVDEEVDIPEGTQTLVIDVLDNDRPHPTETLELVSIDSNDLPAAVGTITPTLGPNGFLTFNLAAGAEDFFGGPYTITYTIADSSGVVDPDADTQGTLTINIVNVNDAPTAQPKADFVGKNPGSVTIDVLDGAIVGPANEVGIDQLRVSAVTQGAKGSVVINANGTVTYTPAPGQSGQDTFTYTISDRAVGDAAAQTDTETVTINITPNAVNDNFSVGEDSLVGDAETILDVLDNDEQFVFNGTLSVTAVTQGARGTVTIVNGGADVQYIPNLNFYGTDSFTYTMTDGVRTATATVNVTVTEENDNPTANPATLTIIRGNSAEREINLLPFTSTAPDDAANTNGTPVSETLSITAVTSPGSAGGTLRVDASGKVFYTPPAVSPPSGVTDDFTYTVSDNRGGSATATLKISILDYVPVNVGGYVYLDSGNGAGGLADGIRNPGEQGYGGVKITITGTDFLGNAFTDDVLTKADGSYEFIGLVPGTYDIIQDQPQFVVDGVETVGAQGGSVVSQYNATTGARDTIRVSFPITGAPSGALGNNFGEKGLNVVALMQSNQANGGPTGNIWLADLAASATRAGFMMYVDGGSVSISQTINGWANLSSVTGTLNSSNQLTLTFTPISGSPMTKTLTLNADVTNGFRILGYGPSGGLLIRIDASAEVMFGKDPLSNPFLPPGSGAGGEGESFAAGVDAVFGAE